MAGHARGCSVEFCGGAYRIVSDTALALRAIDKRFGVTTALAGASLTVRRGTLHAVLGENGAGKTTLMRIAFGMLRPDAGTRDKDQPVALRLERRRHAAWTRHGAPALHARAGNDDRREHRARRARDAFARVKPPRAFARSAGERDCRGPRRAGFHPRRRRPAARGDTEGAGRQRAHA